MMACDDGIMSCDLVMHVTPQLLGRPVRVDYSAAKNRDR